MNLRHAGGTSIVKRVNVGRVLEELRHRREPLRIGELSTLTGLTRPTVTQIVDQLAAAGWLEERGHSRSVGRPAVRVALNPRRVAGVGLDMGLHRIAAHVRDVWGDLLGEAVSHHEITDARLLLNEAVRVARQAIDAAGMEPDTVLSIAVASIGVIDQSTGRLTVARRLQGGGGLDIATYLSSALEAPVRVDNDANLAARAMLLLEDAPTSFITLQWGERLGAGIVLDGRLHRGVNFAAGEIGAMTVQDPWTGAPENLEHALSPSRLEATATEFAEREPRSAFAADLPPSGVAEYVFRSSATGDPTAIRLVDDLAGVIVSAILPVCLALDVGCIFITGGIARGGPGLVDAIERRMAGKLLMPLQVILSPFAEDTVVRGAGAFAVETAWEWALADEIGALELAADPPLASGRPVPGGSPSIAAR